MADPIKRIVEIEAQLAGFGKAAKDVAALEKSIKKIIEANKDNIKSEKELSKIVELELKVREKFAKQQEQELKTKEKLYKESQLQNSIIGKNIASLKGLGTGYLAAAVGGAALGQIISSSVSSIKQYNESLLSSVVAAEKWGDSSAELENIFDRISAKTALARKETISLYKQYEGSARIVSGSGFEGIINRITSLKGPQSQAAAEMLDGVIKLQDAYPELQVAIDNISSASKEQKDRLREVAYYMQETGKFSRSTTRVVLEYIDSNKKNNEELSESVKAMQRFTEASERIKIAVGKFLIPVVESAAHVFERIAKGVDRAAIKVTEFLQVVNSFSGDRLFGKMDKDILSQSQKLWDTKMKAEEDAKKKTGNEDQPKKTETVKRAMYEMELEKLKSISKFREDNIKLLNAEIESQVRSGNAISNRILPLLEKSVAKIDEEYRKTRIIISARNQAYKIALQDGEETIRSLEIKGEVVKLETRLKELSAERNAIIAKGTDHYQGQLDFLTKTAAIEQTRVQLLDNFAIGVGASAEARMAAFEAVGKEVETLKEMADLQNSIANDLSKTEESRNEAKRKVLDIENQILQKQMAQANMVKALRDGWISAIGAMNTGAGRFSKIMVTSQQNLTTGLSKFKMITSNISGSNLGGFSSSERFSAGGAGIINNAKFGTPYETYADRSGAFGAEGAARAGASKLGNVVQRMGQQAAPGAAAGLTATGQPIFTGAYSQQAHRSTITPGRTGKGAGSINAGRGTATGTVGSLDISIPAIHLHIKNFENKKIGDVIEAAVNNAVTESISQISVFGNKPGGLESSRTALS